MKITPKEFQDNYLSGALLVCYSAYTAFVQVTPAHSIILLSLAGLFGFNQFLLRQEIKQNNKNDLDQLKQDFEARLTKHDGKVQKLENELGQLSISMGVRSGSSPLAPKRESQKVSF